MLTPRQKQAVRVAGLIVGLGLLAAAVWFALQRASELPRLAAVSPIHLAGIAAAIFANLALTTTLFWVITLSFDATPRVTWRTMAALISGSALLNYLPLQAGSIGRAAYLKLYNALPVRQSVVIQFVVVALTLLVPAAMVGLLAAVPAPGAGWWAMVALIAIAAAVTPPVARAALKRRGVAAWSWVPLKALDLFVTSLRVWLAFRIVGETLSYPQALAVAGGVAVVNLLSISPNGLGFREWAVAAIASMIAPALAPAGVLATLVDRAVEAVVFIVVGLVSIAWLKTKKEIHHGDTEARRREEGQS